MSGNSKNRPGIRKTNKKGAVKGSGGARRRGLRGKGPTPKAEDRVYHAAHKRKLERQRRDQGRHDRSASTELVVGRNPVIECLHARVRAMTEVLGFDPLSDQWQDGESVRFDAPMMALDALVQEELNRREIARSVKDWETADAVRDRLLEVGIIVTDTPEGPTWSWVP